MDSGLLAAILALVGSAIVGGGAYAGVRRKSTGNVATSSDAADIWAEGKNIREMLRDEVQAYREQLRETERRLGEAIDKVNRLLRDVAESRAATAEARAETIRLRGELAHLQETMDQVHQEVRTMNGLTMAELADNAETRRIDELPPAERTAGDVEHAETVGITESSEGTRRHD